MLEKRATASIIIIMLTCIAIASMSLQAMHEQEDGHAEAEFTLVDIDDLMQTLSARQKVQVKKILTLEYKATEAEIGARLEGKSKSQSTESVAGTSIESASSYTKGIMRAAEQRLYREYRELEDPVVRKTLCDVMHRITRTSHVNLLTSDRKKLGSLNFILEYTQRKQLFLSLINFYIDTIENNCAPKP